MPDDNTSTPLDPAREASSANARDGEQGRQDPNEPVAIVGLGASAGGLGPMQQLLGDMPADSGLAFVVVMHLSPDYESQLPGVLQHKTAMPVIQVMEPVKVRPNHIYVIPPNKQLTFEDGTLEVTDPQQPLGRRVTIDLFFRTMAHSYGPRAVCVILSGADQDGVIGLRHVRAQGGLTIAQDPKEAEHSSMPANAIKTGMVDWVLPVADIAPKLMEFVRNENRMQLPPEIPEATGPDMKVAERPDGPAVSDETRREQDEWALGDVLAYLHGETGHNFAHYKRATLLRRIARRMQVNTVETIPQYLDLIRADPAEPAALLQDLLINVTHFFRDPAAFETLEENIPQLFAGKRNEDQVRVWVAGCATGEEAYSIAILLCEHADRLEAPPSLQVFATDIDDQSIHEARHALYPPAIEADVSQERLRRFFVRDEAGYRVKKDLRDLVVFASHNVLTDAPFSRLDLVSCRNLLIYLSNQAQEQGFDVFHFALRPGGMLFIGPGESANEAQGLFSPVDAKHRLFVRRSVPRPRRKIPVLPPRLPTPLRKTGTIRPTTLPVMARATVEEASTDTRESHIASNERRGILFAELHLKLLEHYGPPSVLINEAHDIVHLSENAGRYLTFRPGEPSTNLLNVIDPALRTELRTALFRASRSDENVIVPAQQVHVAGETEVIDLHVRPIHRSDSAHGFFLVLFEKQKAALSPGTFVSPRQSLSREVDDELQSVKEQLHGTIEQYEVSSAELKASNEELQALNEEMRSAAEELETSQEELRSVNEELTMVNNELKDKVDALSQANSDLQNLMFATDVGTIFLDREMRIKRFTPRVQEVFNLLASDVGRPISDITHKFAYEEMISDAEKVLRTLKTIENEVRVGEDGWFLTRISPYRTADDHIAGVVATFIDISERKRSEMELAELSKQLANQLQKFNTMMTAVPDFVYEFDLDGRFTYVNQSLLDLWGKKYEEAVGRDFYELDYPTELSAKLQRQIQEVIDTRRPLKDETPYISSLGERMYEYLFFPLQGEDGRVKTVGGVTRDITDRKIAEEKIRAGAVRYRTLFDLVPVAVYTTDADGNIQEFNHRAVDLWGRTPDLGTEKFCGSFKMFHPDGRPMSHDQCPMARVLRGEELQASDLEVLVERDDGTRHSVVVAPRTLHDENGRITGAINCVHDITHRKHAEELLRESEERFRTVADNVPQVIWTNEPGGAATYFNKQWYAYTGLGYDESAGPGWQKVVHPDDAPASVERWQRALTAGKVFDAEYRLRRHDGVYRWHLGRNVPLRDNGDVVGWFGTATDIDDFKQAEAAFKESDERFRLLVEGARDYAMFLLSPDNTITFWSKGAERVFGWTEQEAIGRSGNLIFTLEDKAKGAVEREIETALREGRALDRRYHLRKDGSRFWTDGILMRLDDPIGQPRGFAKIARDAADQRRAEDELRHARDQLEQRVLERTADLMATNNELERTMVQREQLERELLEISERERRRIGQDLHDIVCQELTATALFLKSAGNKSDNAETSKTLSEAAEIVNRNVAIARDLARGFQPSVLATGGLAGALRTLCKEANERHGMHCTLKLPRAIRVRDEIVALNLYRIAQEAMRNSTTHSKGDEIVICIERERELIRLVIEDNGKGFRQRKAGKGLGLHIMKYRANVLGGTLTIDSRAQRGTKVLCEVPIRNSS